MGIPHIVLNSCKDLNKVLVKKWQLVDDAYNVLVFDKSGKIVFNQSGAFDNALIKKLLDTITANL